MRRWLAAGAFGVAALRLATLRGDFEIWKNIFGVDGSAASGGAIRAGASDRIREEAASRVKAFGFPFFGFPFFGYPFVSYTFEEQPLEGQTPLS